MRLPRPGSEEAKVELNCDKVAAGIRGIKDSPAIRRRRGAPIDLNLGRHLAGANAKRRGNQARTAAEGALLGTAPDAAVAKRLV
ncbi:MAG TPA: hypothetical protein VGF55_22000 [Gemmataceae bacterium]|jgi:hypothetical protein